MSRIATIAAAIFRKSHGRRIVVGIAGAPGSGKSTLTEGLRDALVAGGQTVAIVPMDGFHYDDAVLAQRGLSARKGAPETFDFAGYAHLLNRIRSGGDEVAAPAFDRGMELSRAGAIIVPAETSIILTEGNYLLLDEHPWASLAPLFDLTIFVEVPRDELERRLLRRWQEHGRSPEAGRAWVDGNDLPNVDRVLARRRPADIVT